MNLTAENILIWAFAVLRSFFAAETKHKEDTCFKEARKQFVLFAWSSESAKTSASLLPSGLFHVWYYCECCVTWRGCLYSEESSKFRICQNSYCNVLYSECFWSPKQNVCTSPFHKPLRISFCSYLSGVSCFCWCAHGIQGVAWWEVSMQTSPLQLTGTKMATEVSFIPIFLRFQTDRDLDTDFQFCCSEGKGEAGYVQLEMHWMTHSLCTLIGLPMLKWAAWWVDTADSDHPPVPPYHIWFQKCCKYGHLWKVLISVCIFVSVKVLLMISTSQWI